MALDRPQAEGRGDNDRALAEQPPPLEPRQGDDDGDEDYKRLPVYQAIVDHQRGAAYWPHRAVLEWHRKWGGRLIREFRIRIKDSELLGLPLVKIERLNIKTISTYRERPDGFALAGTIVVNEKRLNVPDTVKLAHLLKSLLCAWRHLRCPDDLFIQGCLAAFKQRGLSVTRTSITIEPDSYFYELLKEDKVSTTPGERVLVPEPTEPGKSTNHIWSCPCQRVRVGTAEFEALCLRCGAQFQRGDNVTIRTPKRARRENRAP